MLTFKLYPYFDFLSYISAEVSTSLFSPHRDRGDPLNLYAIGLRQRKVRSGGI